MYKMPKMYSSSLLVYSEWHTATCFFLQWQSNLIEILFIFFSPTIMWLCVYLQAKTTAFRYIDCFLLHVRVITCQHVIDFHMPAKILMSYYVMGMPMVYCRRPWIVRFQFNNFCSKVWIHLKFLHNNTQYKMQIWIDFLVI